jgi:phosphate starvation-inducible PhoH-like protein
MTRRKKTTDQAGIGAGLTAKQMRRKKPINSDLLLNIEPLTENQKKLFSSYDEGKHIVAHGVPGSGKTFVLLYKALKEVLDEISPYEKIYIIRSLVQTREIGFLPGSHEDKAELFEIPYKNMVKYMFQLPSEADFEMLYGNLKSQETISFWSTSFLRGTTFDNSILIIDEFSNMNAHELDSLITRVGENCKIMFAGDAEQTDLVRKNERTGIHDFMRILQLIDCFEIIEFGVEDIVRSGLVRQYILAKRELGLSML